MLSNLMEEIASNEVLDEAYRWLCKRREDYSHNDDVWELRFRWNHTKPVLQATLLAGRYHFSSQRRIHRTDDDLEIWSAHDSLVLKAMAIVLTKHLAPRISSRCFHLAGNGGAKAAVREVVRHLHDNKFVFRTDVKSYYASINHDVLYSQLRGYIDDRKVLDLLSQYMRRTIYDGGLYEDVEQGISLGCPLSPLMGALFLDVLDKRIEATGLFYVRFMDDWVVLAPTRWKLRKAVRIVNEILAKLQVDQHPDKTFVGKIDKGFDFLGYHFEPDRLTIAEKARKNFVVKVRQLYEQGADAVRIGKYVRRWFEWVRGGFRTWRPWHCHEVTFINWTTHGPTLTIGNRIVYAILEPLVPMHTIEPEQRRY